MDVHDSGAADQKVLGLRVDGCYPRFGVKDPGG